MPILQVTIPSAGIIQISTHGIGFRQLIVQNNSSDTTVRWGDSSIVAGAYGTGKGLLVPPSSTGNAGANPVQQGILSNEYVAGTPGTVLDIRYDGA